jgi:hypothetical protein
MTPEIRAAVKTLAIAFKVIVEALAEEERPMPKPSSPPAPAPGHESHLVMKPGGWTDFCCPAHERLFEAQCARYGPPERTIDALSGPQRRYLSARLGGGPGVGPRR